MPHSITQAELEYELTHIHDDRRPGIIVSTVICLVIASIAVLLRLYARRLRKAKLLADDYMIMLALLALTGQVAAVWYAVHLGEGRHVVLLENVPAYAKSITAQEVLYCVSTGTFKLSALLLAHRIFNTVPRFTPILWAVAAVIIINNIVDIFLSIFQSYSVQKAGTPEAKAEHINIHLAAYILGSINVLLDFVVAMLPIPLILRLQMQTTRKAQLAALFFLSGVVCIASICRTILVKRLSHEDATWADVDPSTCAAIENAIGILCASLPTLRPVFVFSRKGHFCSSSKPAYCERCSRRSRSKGSSIGSQPWPGNVDVSNDQRRGDRRSYSNVEAVGRGGPTTLEVPKAAFEMC